MMKKILCTLCAILITYCISAQKFEPTTFSVEVKGKGKPVFFIPGLTCPGEVWDEAVESFQEKYECHILSLAGFAGEPAIDFKDAFLPKVENEIVQYIENNLQQKPIIIGHSLGGFLALSINQQKGDLLEKIVIVDSFPFYSAAMIPNATEEMVKPQAEMMKNMMLNMEDAAFESQQKMTAASMTNVKENESLLVKWSMQSNRATVAQATYELMTTDLRKEMHNAQAPILVLGSWVAGKDFGITKETVENNYKTQFENAKFCSVKIAEFAKHFIMWDEPIWFYEAITTFLDK